MSELEPGSSSRISTAGGEKLHVAGKGKVAISTDFGEIKIGNILYVPGVTKNLLSIGTITDGKEKYKLLFDSGKVWILKDFPTPKNHHIVTMGYRHLKNGLYRFRPPAATINNVIHVEDQQPQLSCLWHRGLGHANLRTMQFMASKAIVDGLPSSFSALPFCLACRIGKQTRERIPNKRPRLSYCTACKETRTKDQGTRGTAYAPQLLELIHTDLCGPISTPSPSGSRYIMTFTDDFSRYTCLFFLKLKSETLSKFQQFKSMIERQGNIRIKAIRSNSGGEYTSKAFVNFCEESRISRKLTQAHTPHQNGIAERKNRSLIEKARRMAFESNLPPSLWTEAVSTANYVINRTATSANGGDTLFSKLTSLKPSVKHL